MAVSPITSIPLPNAGATDQVPADLMTAFTAAEKFFVGKFASAAARDAKITSPQTGMMCWLDSPGCFSERLPSGWKNRYSTGVQYWGGLWPNASLAGNNGITTATFAVTPNTGPYLLRVSIGAVITAVGSAIPTLQMFCNGSQRAAHLFASISSSSQKLTGTLTREFPIADGSTISVYGRVDIPTGTTVQTYTNDSESFISISATPM